MDWRIIMTARMYILTAVCLVFVLTGAAWAQDETPAELRAEIASLREQLAVLEADRAQLIEQIESMKAATAELQRQLDAERARVEELQAALAARPVRPAQEDRPAEPVAEEPTSSEPAPVAEIPPDPLASPASLLRALRESHRQTFPDLSLESRTARETYQRRLQLWLDVVRQSLRGQTRWRITFTEITPDARNRQARARMQVIDPNSGLPIGESFLGTIPSRMLLKMDDRAEAQTWDVTLVLNPNPVVNPERLEAGPFDYPPLIGPMVEFQFDFDWIGMRRVRTASDSTSETEQTPRP